MLLQESSLISLTSLIPLVEEHLWSLEVIGLWECVKNSLVESSSSFVWIAGMEYIVDQNL